MHDSNKKKIVWLYSFDHRENPFIILSLRTLASEGYSVLIVDRAVSVENTNEYSHRPIKKSKINYFFRYYWLCKLALQVVVFRFDIVFTSMPDVLIIGWILKKIKGVKLIYHPFELWGDETSIYSRNKYWHKGENWILKKEGALDGLITQNKQRAMVYREERKSSVIPTILYNYKAYKNTIKSNRLREKAGIPNGAKIVLYEGIIKRFRCLPELIGALRYLPADIYLVIMGHFDLEYESEFKRIIAESETMQRIILLPPVSYDELLEYISGADLGVAIYTNENRNNYFCAPGKISDYVIAGIPLIAPSYPSIQNTIEENGIGICYETVNSKSIADAIVKVFEYPNDHWALSLKKASQTLVWETQASTLVNTVNKVLRSKTI